MSGDSLDPVLSCTGPVLLDFDGPVTRLLPRPANAGLADAAREPLWAARIDLPESVAVTSDHIAVLRFAHTCPHDVEQAVEAACRAGELRGAAMSEPTPGVTEFLHACAESGRPVAIASNNAPEAIAAYLDRQQIAEKIQAVVGRPDGQPHLMKPNPAILLAAAARLEAEISRCVMIGDTVSDVTAAHAAGIQVIGYAKSAERGQALGNAGAAALTDSMATLARAVLRVARTSS